MKETKNTESNTELEESPKQPLQEELGQTTREKSSQEPMGIPYIPPPPPAL